MKLQTVFLLSMLLSCATLQAKTAIWCTAMETDPTVVSDVSEFKPMKVKKVFQNGLPPNRKIPYEQTQEGLVSIDSKDLRQGDIIDMILLDASGKEYTVTAYEDKSLRFYVRGSSFVFSAGSYLGFTGPVIKGAHDVIINCKNEM